MFSTGCRPRRGPRGIRRSSTRSQPPKGSAFQIALRLNNRYALDGRDPNSFAGVAWCFGKHDQAWKERPVFGRVRYMNAAGLDRKYRMGRYLERVTALEAVR